LSLIEGLQEHLKIFQVNWKELACVLHRAAVQGAGQFTLTCNISGFQGTSTNGVGRISGKARLLIER
jgi:hypothetical protein